MSRLDKVRVVGGGALHGAYRFFLQHYRRCVETEHQAVPGASPASMHARSKAVFEALGLPYLMPRIDYSGGYHSAQRLLVTSSPWTVDLEHATPFVGTNYLRFFKPSVKRVVTSLLTRENCRGIICWSEASRRSFLVALGAPGLQQKTHVLRPTIDNPLLKRKCRMRRRLRKILFVFNKPEHNFFIKSGLEVVRAFELIEGAKRGMELHIVGPVPAQARVALGNRAGIVCHGIMPFAELASTYAACDLLVLPTVTDTFGMVFLEAFSTGMPAVGVSFFATPEIVSDGYNGLLIPYSSTLVSWMGTDGIPTMASESFIEQRRTRGADENTSIAIAASIQCCTQSSLLSHLSEGAAATMTIGPYSNRETIRAAKKLFACTWPETKSERSS